MLQVLCLLVLPLLTVDDTSLWNQFGGGSGRFQVYSKQPDIHGVVEVWKAKIGPGTSQIITDGTSLFTLFSQVDPKNKKEGVEIVISLDGKTGQERWRHAHPVAMLKGQESFSGDPVRPQATPVIHQGKLYTLGYAGMLHCLDAANGNVIWKSDLVKDHQAKPVQFGFSGSPIVHDQGLIVHTGGVSAVMKFDLLNGTVIWKSEAAQPSYATPFIGTMFGEETLVQLTRDSILGLSPRDGTTRWTYPLPKIELTNVPTPLILPGEKLLISGQGVAGTRLLQFSKSEKGIESKELWKNEKVIFFYCNWIIMDDVLYGNQNKLLTAIDLKTGVELWRERGYTDGNLLRWGEQVFIVDDKGQFSRVKLSRTGVEKLFSQNLLSTRCWTAPSVMGSLLLLRDQETIVALKRKD